MGKQRYRRHAIRAAVAACALAAAIRSAAADVITPVSATASSYYSWQQNPIELINNIGQDTSSGNVESYVALANSNANGIWQAGAGQGIEGSGPTVDTQYVEFDLGEDYDLSSAYLWQMIQSSSLAGRGIDSFALYGSPNAPAASGSSPTAAGNTFTEILGSATLAEAIGSTTPTQTFSLSNADDIRTVYLQINSDWNNAASDYVGLSEIKFAGTPTANAAPLYTWNGSSFVGSGTPDYSSGADDFAFTQSGTYGVNDTGSTWFRNLNVSAGTISFAVYVGTPSDYSIGYLQTNAINVTGGSLSIIGDLIGGVNSQQNGESTLGGTVVSFNTLNISGGGQVIDNSSPVSGYNSLIIGQTPGFSAAVNVSGAGSSLVAPALSLGDGATSNTGAAGSLWITAGGNVTSNGIVYNGEYGGTGFISADGNGSSLVVSSGNLLIGYGTGGSAPAPGEGTLIITDGAQVTDAGDVQIGAYGGMGSVIIGKSDGTDTGNSTLSAADLYVTVGSSAGGTLNVNPGGNVRISGTLYAETTSGTINLAGGAIQAGTVSLDTISNLNWTSGQLWLTGGAFSGGSASSTLTVPVGGTLVGSGTIDNRVTVLGTIQPGGNSAATFTTSNLTIGNSGARGVFAANIDFSSLAASLLDVTSTTAVDLSNAALTLSLLDAPDFQGDETFLLIESKHAITGTFASLPDLPGVSYNVIYDYSGSAVNGTGNGDDVAITFTAVPEPDLLALLPLPAAAGLLRRRRPAVG